MKIQQNPTVSIFMKIFGWEMTNFWLTENTFWWHWLMLISYLFGLLILKEHLMQGMYYGNTGCGIFKREAKLYTPSTLNVDLLPWHTQLIVFAENVKSWFKSWVFPFTFKAYTMPHTLNCMYISLFKFHIWIKIGIMS